MKKKMRFNTKAIHGGQILDPAYGSVMTPIYQTSTYAQTSPGKHKGYEYSRTHNPTRTNLENSIASLENGKYGLAFSSGLAAIDALLKTLSPGDEVISTNDLYGGSYRLFKTIFQKYDIKFHFVNMEDIKNIEDKITKNTRLIWLETPTNPMMNIIDIKSLAKLSKKNKILLCVDNTFASPYLQRPLELGADIIIHSATKYIAGHSDVIIGAIVINNKRLHEKLAFIQNASGATPGPMDSFLTLRGIKTLHLRMQRHSENAKKIAYFLKRNPKIGKVYWPGFSDHTNHKIAKKQMKDFGGIVSFIPKQSNFKTAKKNDVINLEKSLKYGDRISGHFVQGHIDTTSRIKKIDLVGNSWFINFNLSKRYKKYIIQKGSITINGVSLTISKIFKDGFQVVIIPQTLKLTNLIYLKNKVLVNLEFDVIGKYINSFLK